MQRHGIPCCSAEKTKTFVDVNFESGAEPLVRVAIARQCKWWLHIPPTVPPVSFRKTARPNHSTPDPPREFFISKSVFCVKHLELLESEATEKMTNAGAPPIVARACKGLGVSVDHLKIRVRGALRSRYFKVENSQSDVLDRVFLILWINAFNSCE